LDCERQRCLPVCPGSTHAHGLTTCSRTALELTDRQRWVTPPTRFFINTHWL